MLKAIFLDLDDTLVDRQRAFEDWARSFLDELGAAPDDLDRMVEADRRGTRPRDEFAAEIIRQEAKAMFQAVDGYGLARVDFFVTEQGEVVFNEINTMPGFTAISMYPTLWEARGVTKAQLIQNLIDSAKERWNG